MTPKHIKFVEVPSKLRTKIWYVFTLDHVPLGQVRWYAHWYQYAFYPANDTVFEKTCLTDLATFCQQETTKHRGNWKTRKPKKPA